MAIRVLVADVSPMWRERYHRFFAERGCEIETAGGGVECLAKLDAFDPDLLFLDLEIPWGGGDGVLDRLRESHWRRRTAVVLTGGENTSATLKQLSAPPVVKWLLKPFDEAVLRETVGMALLSKL